MMGTDRGTFTRRSFLAASCGIAASCGAPGVKPPGRPDGRIPVAAVITEYRRNSHADVIVGRMLEGYEYYGEFRTPGVRVVAMYTDQVPANDLSREMAARHGVRIAPTIADAVAPGGKLAVEGVVIVGEHGNYPYNEKGQHLYPRFELFQRTVECFLAAGKTVPVFCDKHMSYDWSKARRMYDWSKKPGFPFLAGSSVPLAWRHPPVEIDHGARIDRAVTVFYGGKESYGFHALEALQCMAERRAGGETGVSAVRCVEGPEVWEWTSSHAWSETLLDAALSRCPNRKPGSPRDTVKAPILFEIEYTDGLRAAVYLLNGHVETTGFAASVRGVAEPVSTEMWLQPARPFSHFSGLVYHIEEMMITGKAPYPAERTLLTTGMLAALMDSSWKKGARIQTPHLAISYRAPKRSFFNRGAVPKEETG